MILTPLVLKHDRQSLRNLQSKLLGQLQYETVFYQNNLFPLASFFNIQNSKFRTKLISLKLGTCKVQLFWEGHKNLKKISQRQNLWFYWILSIEKRVKKLILCLRFSQEIFTRKELTSVWIFSSWDFFNPGNPVEKVAGKKVGGLDSVIVYSRPQCPTDIFCPVSSFRLHHQSGNWTQPRQKERVP